MFSTKKSNGMAKKIVINKTKIGWQPEINCQFGRFALSCSPSCSRAAPRITLLNEEKKNVNAHTHTAFIRAKVNKHPQR